jgi:hypothetical protein
MSINSLVYIAHDVLKLEIYLWPSLVRKIAACMYTMPMAGVTDPNGNKITIIFCWGNELHFILNKFSN